MDLEPQDTDWYQVRNNLSHRGTSAFRDGKLVLKSLVELHDTLRIVLMQRLPEICSDGASSTQRARSSAGCFCPAC